MTRLFDAEKEQKAVDEAKNRRDEIRRRAAEFDDAAREAGIMDNTAGKVAKLMGAVETVQSVKYDSYRKPGGRITIEHAVRGRDYIYQVFPLKPPTIEQPDILLQLIGAMDGVFPRSVHVNYQPPADLLPQKFYTVTVLEVVGKPGWQEAVGRALQLLSELELWP